MHCVQCTLEKQCTANHVIIFHSFSMRARSFHTFCPTKPHQCIHQAKKHQWNYISPRSVWNAVRFLSSSPIGICQNRLVKSIFEIYFPNLLCTNSILGIGSASERSRVQTTEIYAVPERTIQLPYHYCGASILWSRWFSYAQPQHLPTSSLASR